MFKADLWFQVTDGIDLFTLSFFGFTDDGRGRRGD